MCLCGQSPSVVGNGGLHWVEVRDQGKSLDDDVC
jgi:hypothetical protein